MTLKEYLEQLKQYLSYNPDTGILTWIKKKQRIALGQDAGTLTPNGYIQIGFRGKTYKAHRIAWFLYYGFWPEKAIDHINGVKTDNKIENLREVTNRGNSQNLHRHRNGRLVGTCFDKTRKKWQAMIKVGQKNKYLGRHNTEQEAHEAYKNYITEQGLK